MTKKSPKELEVGMILTSEVTNLDGQTLFKKGMEINERHIQILLMWGIPHVEVEGDEDQAIKNGNQESLNPLIAMRAEALCNERFKLTKSSHPVVELIRNISYLETAHRLQREQVQ